MKRYQVPVMVTFECESHPPESSQAADALWAFVENYGFLDPEQELPLVSIDGIPADPDDPNSPPVPASLDETEVGGYPWEPGKGWK